MRTTETQKKKEIFENELDDIVSLARKPLKTKTQQVNIDKKIKAKVRSLTKLLVCLIFALPFLLLGCQKKETKEDQMKMKIAQAFKMTNISVSPLKTTKDWQIGTWAWIWNEGSFPITFRCNNYPQFTDVENYTIDQLMTGINVALYPAIYDIRYNSTHDPSNMTYCSNHLDAAIEMDSVIVDGTPIGLQGQYSDYMIIVDMIGVQSVDFDGQITNRPVFSSATGDQVVPLYWYAYIDPYVTPDDQLGNLVITFDPLTGRSPAKVDFSAIAPGQGYIYHIITVYGNEQFTAMEFPNWNFQDIQVN